MILAITSVYFVFATISHCCFAYPTSNTSNETISYLPGEEVSEAPEYHMRIVVKPTDQRVNDAICFGALVHVNYIVTFRDNCLDFNKKNIEAEIRVYAARKDLVEIEGVKPTSINPSKEYNIGVIYVENGFKNAKPIKLRVFGHRLPEKENVNIYGFNKKWNDKMKHKTTMHMDKLRTVKLKEWRHCFHGENILKYGIITTLLDSSQFTAVDYGSPIEYINERGEKRLVGLVMEETRDSTSNCGIILINIELSQKGIAKELHKLSNNKIDIRK